MNKTHKLCWSGGLVLKNLINDHRTRVTRHLIRKAFTDLLSRKPIQSISVKELCETAGINRGTFYTHYTDIYDLKKQLQYDSVRMPNRKPKSAKRVTMKAFFEAATAAGFV